MRSLIVLALLCLPACIDPSDDKCDGTVIEVDVVHTVDGNGDVVSDPCSVPSGNGTDYSGCCPDGYDFLSLGTEGVLCEEDCDEGAALVAATETAVFVAHGVADAYLDAVEAAYTPAP